MSELDRRPVPRLRVEDVRVDHRAPNAVPDDASTAVQDDGDASTRRGRFRRALEQALDGWHVIPTEPWW